eukprot:GHVP01023666.1.p1 GENE.GHVP01023666.1~~GHVP01023666.1.p1  ORF type:complete len:164 (-),score=17.94 GHVP01023666.1:84-539(-)
MTVKEEARKKYDFYKEIFSLRVQGKLKKAPSASHYDLPAASTQESSTEVSSTQPFLPEAFSRNSSQPPTNCNPNFHQWTPQQNPVTHYLPGASYGGTALQHSLPQYVGNRFTFGPRYVGNPSNPVPSMRQAPLAYSAQPFLYYAPNLNPRH